MIRTIAALALACSVGASSLYAQDLQFVVRAESAGVHRSPSTGSPIIGHAPRGTVLQVTRELGSWVRVTWPASPDGVAYVHVSLGTLSHHDAAPLPARPIGSTPVAARSAQSPAPAPVPTRRVEPSSQPLPVRASYVRPPAHAVGIGAWVGAVHPGFGGSARFWSRDRIGVQLEVSRTALTSALTPDRVTSIQFAPSVLVSPHTRVSDYFSLRPYAGAGISANRQTLTMATPADSASSSDLSMGLQTFGGAEATFAGLPQFALSVDVGYRRARTPFPGFDPSGATLGISGHWFVR